MRFLAAAKRLEESQEEKKIQSLKQQSFLLNSTLDFMNFQRDKKGHKTNVFLESKSSTKKISFLLKKLKGERVSVTSQEVSNNPRLSIESPFIPINKLNPFEITEKEELNEKDLQKPIFFYLPQEDEIKEMIFTVLKEIAKEEEYFRKITVPKRRRK